VNPWIMALVQVLLLVALAPLLSGWVKTVKCLLQNRRPPPPWQPYRDLMRLFTKEVVLADDASILFRAAPYMVFGATVLAASILPFVAVDLPTARVADAIALVAFLALGRFFLALAGLDVGTAFGGMGASREMTLSALAEPAVLMIIFTLAMSADSTNLSRIVGHVLDTGAVVRPSFVFAFMALVLVALTETGRIPVDNPATHLELTMIHEAMILEYSGRLLALMEWGAQIKLTCYAVLIANLFLPWGIATTLTPMAVLGGTLAIIAKLALLGTLLAVTETLMTKMRLFLVPQFLTVAFVLAFLGMASHVVLEVGVEVGIG